MLTSEYLLNITEAAENISSELHKSILDKIIARIMTRLGKGEDYILTATDKWQIEVLEEAGYLLEDIQAEIAAATQLQTAEIKTAMEDAGVESTDYDDKIYESAGISPAPLKKSPTMLRILQRDYEATAGEWRNFCRTTANESQRLFINQMDKAYRQVISGSTSYSTAVRDVIKDIIRTGVKISYPSGYKMSVKSATAMIVRTGISQATSDVSIARAAENGVAYVLVSSHMGARPSHQKWQGKIYSVDWDTLKRLKPGLIGNIKDLPKPSKKYPDFVKSTRYGEVDGLCGANCRHSFSVYYPGISQNPFERYNNKENKEEYEKQQKQRSIERNVRKSKRNVQNLQTAMENCKDEKLLNELQQEYDKKAYHLKQQNASYRQYCKDNNLKTYHERLNVAKWNREQASKAAGAARRYEKEKEGKDGK